MLFCNEVGCSEVFTDQEEFDKHVVEGRHTNGVEETTAMDKVRRSFTSRMKVSSQKYMSDGGIELEDADVLSADEECQTMSMFSNVGWALPVRSTFRYSLKQKKVLYDYFMQGEENGKKMSADQVAQLSRNKFITSEYLTAKQIKSLFSRWTKMRRVGQLKPPAENDGSIEEEIENDEEVESDYHAEIQQEAVRITNEMSWSVNDWVVCEYDDKWYPGIVQSIDQYVTVKCMAFPVFGKNCFKWPEPEDISLYDPDDIVCKITPPTPVSSRFLGFCDKDFKDVNACFYSRK